MSANAKSIRKHRLSISELCTFANSISQRMIANVDKFAQFAVTIEKIEEMKELVATLKDEDNDIIYLANYLSAIEDKNSIKKSLLKKMRSIVLRAKLIWGADSAKYRSINPGNIAKIVEAEMINKARQVHSVALSNLHELSKEGITLQNLNEFADCINEMELAMVEVINMNIIRDEASENRNNKSNELYSLVRKYCDYGKILFYNVDSVEYKTFIMYRSPKKRTKKAKEMEENENNAEINTAE